MTVPITPGPFSFIGTAGEALGEYGKVKEEHRQHAENIAHQGLQSLVNLVQMGILPADVIGSPEVRHLMGVAGLELPTGTQVLPQPKEGIQRRAAGLVPGMSDTQIAQASGLPTTEQGKRAEIAGSVLSGPLTPAQQSAVAKVPTATEAAAGEATAGATLADAQLNTRITGIASEQLKNPESGLARLIAYAKSGTLSYLIHQLQSRTQNKTLERQRLSEAFKLFFEPLDNAAQVYQTRYRAWEQRKTVETINFSDDPKAVGEWTRANPPPTVETVQADLLNAAAANLHMTPEEYNKRLLEITGMLQQGDEAVAPARSALLIGVNAVLDGKITQQQAEQKITAKHASSGMNAAPAAQADIAEFRRLLGEERAKRGSTAADTTE